MIPLSLPNQEESLVLTHYIDALTTADKHVLQNLLQKGNISTFIDGRGLACPMPLLKAKIALRSMQVGDSMYILTTDPNSQTDLQAFCKHSGFDIELSTHTNDVSDLSESNLSMDTQNTRLAKFDTIFHVIITKTHGN